MSGQRSPAKQSTPADQRRARLEAQRKTVGDSGFGGGTATLFDGMTGFGPELLGHLPGLSEDKVRADIDAFAQAHPQASAALEWGPVVIGAGGIVKGAVKGGRRIAERLSREGVREAEEVPGAVLKASPTSGLPAADKSDVRRIIVDAAKGLEAATPPGARSKAYGTGAALAASPLAALGGYDAAEAIDKAVSDQSQMSRKRPRR